MPVKSNEEDENALIGNMEQNFLHVHFRLVNKLNGIRCLQWDSFKTTVNCKIITGFVLNLKTGIGAPSVKPPLSKISVIFQTQRTWSGIKLYINSIGYP